MGFHFRTPAEAEVKVLWAGLEVVCRWDAAELDTWDDTKQLSIFGQFWIFDDIWILWSSGIEIRKS